jgi:hypothetical protein
LTEDYNTESRLRRNNSLLQKLTAEINALHIEIRKVKQQIQLKQQLKEYERFDI